VSQSEISTTTRVQRADQDGPPDPARSGSSVDIALSGPPGQRRPLVRTADPIPPIEQPVRPGLNLVWTDLLCVVLAVGLAQLVTMEMASQPSVHFGRFDAPYPLFGIAFVLLWMTMLQVHDTRSPRMMGHGTEEYRRVGLATLRTGVVLAALIVVFKVDLSRIYLAVALVGGYILLLTARKLARARLHRSRARGEGLANVLVVGGHRSAAELGAWFSRHPASGFRVIAVWDPDEARFDAGAGEAALLGIPLMSAELGFGEAVRRSRASTVVVTDTEHLGNESVKELIWALEGTRIQLLLSPNVHGIDSSRLQVHDLSSMPLLEVAEPQYAGASRLGKTVFDRVGATLILLALSPILLATAIAVKVTSLGPVFYRQERVGMGAQPFAMFKFRSMRVGADSELEALLAREGKTLAELPKLDSDPRVTTVGAFIRRFSIDELPQLFNVLAGDMSLVGPRPQRQFEVEQYDHVAHRRLTVRPGMTGLWQVSGRSRLSYAEAIELDQHYVENWSMMADVIILWKTFRAVVTSDGAW